MRVSAPRLRASAPPRSGPALGSLDDGQRDARSAAALVFEHAFDRGAAAAAARAGTACGSDVFGVSRSGPRSVPDGSVVHSTAVADEHANKGNLRQLKVNLSHVSWLRFAVAVSLIFGDASTPFGLYAAPDGGGRDDPGRGTRARRRPTAIDRRSASSCSWRSTGAGVCPTPRSGHNTSAARDSPRGVAPRGRGARGRRRHRGDLPQRSRAVDPPRRPVRPLAVRRAPRVARSWRGALVVAPR
jgi:hypothetical protein